MSETVDEIGRPRRLWRRTTRNITTGRLARRSVDWFVLGVLITALVVLLEAAYSKSVISAMFEGKLAVLALILALGTFQYDLFQRVISERESQLTDPRWQEYFRRVEAIPEERRPTAVAEEYERNRATWDRHTRDIRQYVRDAILVHNFAVLSNISAVVGALFVSIVMDAALLFRDDDLVILRRVSTGAFFFSAIPFVGLLVRYLYSLLDEERWRYQAFADPPGDGARSEHRDPSPTVVVGRPLVSGGPGDQNQMRIGRRVYLGGLAVAIVIVGVGLCFLFQDYRRDFWPVFVFPALTLVVFQCVALSSWSRKRKLFLVFDYVYYLVVGAVIGVVAMYVMEGGLVADFKETRERERLTDQRSQIEAKLKTARARLTELAARRFDMAAVRACLASNVAGRTRTNLQDAAAQECEAFFERQSLPGQIRVLEEEHRDVMDQETRLATTKPAGASKHPQLKYVLIPTVLLCAITLKLGKTTESLW